MLALEGFQHGTAHHDAILGRQVIVSSQEARLSKRIPARVTCPSCERAFDVELFRSLWIEYPENRKLVSDDKVNVVACPYCKTTTRLEFPFLCTNVQRRIAIWYEPYHDPAVDDDIKEYAKHFGPKSFYAIAPRVRDWNEFKVKLIELEAFSDKQGPLPKASPEMAAAMSSFVGSLRNKQSTDYPRWLVHLRRPALRLLYAAIPFFALLLLAAWNHQESLQDWMDHFGAQILLILITGSMVGFALLTAVHRWLATTEKNSIDNKEIAYYEAVNNFITSHGFYEPLLELQGTDKEYCIASMKMHKAGYLAGQSEKVVGALTMDSVKQYHQNRELAILFLQSIEKQFLNKQNEDIE